MKYLLPFLGIISCLAGQAQKNSSPAVSKHIFIGFNFSLDYDSRTLKNNGGDSFADQIIKVRNDMENGKTGFTTGLSFCMSITKLLGFETGIQYSNKGYQIKKHDLIYQQPDPALPLKAKFIYNYHYIDIPVKVNLTVGKGKIRFISGAGFAANFLLSVTQRNILDYSDGRTVKKKQPVTENFNKVNISPLISLGVECKLKNKLYLRIEPTFRYQVLKNIDEPITEYLWNAGLNTGFYYRL